MLKRECAWCQHDMGFKPGVSGTTHGICWRCYAVELFKIRMAELLVWLRSWVPTAVMLALFAVVCALIPHAMAWEDQQAQQKAVARIVYAVMVEDE